MHTRIKPVPVLCSLALASLLAGCEPKSATPTPPANSSPTTGSAGSSAAATTGTAATSNEAFNNVMGMLDENGSILFYLGTERVFQAAGEKFEAFREMIASMPPEKADDKEMQQLSKAMDYAGKVFKRIGISEIAGMGVSGISVDGELNRSRVVLHHKSDQGRGHMWSLLGEEPHDPFGLDLMPANTMFASSQDLNFAGLWRLIESEIQGLGIDEATKEWNQGKQQFEQLTGLKIDELMKSFGGRFCIALTLDEKERIQIPGPDNKPMEIPRPDLVFAAAVNDALIFERIKKEIPPGDSGITVTKVDGVERIQAPAVFPPVPSLKPLIAFDGGHLFVASSPEALDRALAVKAGKAPGLASTDKFMKLSALAATKGNGFSFADSRLGEIARDMQSKVLAGAPEQAQAVNALMAQLQKPSDMYTSFENTKYGWVWTAVGQQNAAGAMVASVAVAPVAVLAGIAVPSFAKSKEKAQRIKCVNNLKQVALGVKIWASDNNDLYPFHDPKVTKAKVDLDAFGDDRNAYAHFMVMSNEFGSPKILTCPAHPGTKPAAYWPEFKPEHVSYRLRTGPDVTEVNPSEVLVWCPHHHNVALTDGSVLQMKKFDTEQRRPGSWKIR